MPNRILKESICTSDSVDALSWFEEVLFYRLIVNCDDFGRFDGRTAVIKNRLFPLKENLTLKTVSAAINKLVSAGLVSLYAFEGKPYLYLPTWNEHQNVRAKRSKYPDPNESCNHMNSSEIICNQMYADVPVIQSNTKSESESESESKSKSEPRQEPFAAFAAGDADLLSALSGFEQMRKTIKKPLTERAKGSICKKLETLSGGDHAVMIAILDESILHSWQDVYELKPSGAKHGPALDSYTPGQSELSAIQNLKKLRDELKSGDDNA